MEKLANEIKNQSIPKTHFFKLNNIFSIFVFVFLFSFFLSLCSYARHFSLLTDSNDRHYIFLLCNGILFFLIMNFNSTHSSSIKDNQSSVIAYGFKHQPLVRSSAMEEQQEDIKENDENDEDEIEQNVNRVSVIEDKKAVSISEDEDVEHRIYVVEEHEDIEENDDEIEQNLNRVSVIEDKKGVSISEVEEVEHRIYVVEEQETGESVEAGETEEFNKKCAEFITKMKERMKIESSCGRRRFSPTNLNATVTF